MKYIFSKLGLVFIAGALIAGSFAVFDIEAEQVIDSIQGKPAAIGGNITKIHLPRKVRPWSPLTLGFSITAV